MASHDLAPVLILGGYGSVGSRIARMLRRLHPALPLTIAGRDRRRAAALAGELGNADFVDISIDSQDLGLPAAFRCGAVIAALKDHSLNSLRFAEARSVPYVALSDAAFEIAPLVARYVRRPSVPIVMLGHAMGGVPTLSALHVAQTFRTIDTIEIGLVFDPGDPLGPQSAVDMDRIARSGPAPLLLLDGRWRWASPEQRFRRFTGLGGQQHQGEAVGLLDVLSLGAATRARSIRVDVAEAPTATSRRGGPPSHEVIIEITGERNDGTAGQERCELVDQEGYAVMSARGIAVTVERVLGLAGGSAPGPGLYFPETLVDPVTLMQRLEGFGVTVTRSGGQKLGVQGPGRRR